VISSIWSLAGQFPHAIWHSRIVRAEVEVRFTARTVEIFHKGERIAAHLRSTRLNGSGMNKIVRSRSATPWSIKRSNE
jgi:hypothetical protein